MFFQAYHFMGFVLVFCLFVLLKYSWFIVPLVSGIQYNDSNIYMCILFQIFSIMGYYKILNIVPCAISSPCCLSIVSVVAYFNLC